MEVLRTLSQTASGGEGKPRGAGVMALTLEPVSPTTVFPLPFRKAGPGLAEFGGRDTAYLAEQPWNKAREGG